MSTGACNFCGEEKSGTGMTKHLTACRKRKEAIESSAGKSLQLCHIVATPSPSSEYWLHLEMDARRKLQDLDDYLRAIWLECCGHASRFSIGGWGGRELPFTMTIGGVFEMAKQVTHIYDFGTESVTEIRMVGHREGKGLSARPVFLMARNQPPTFACTECDQPGAGLCYTCMSEADGGEGMLCEEHVKGHTCFEEYGEGPGKIFNSPRLGLCGYSGPAEPPY